MYVPSWELLVEYIPTYKCCTIYLLLRKKKRIFLPGIVALKVQNYIVQYIHI